MSREDPEATRATNSHRKGVPMKIAFRYAHTSPLACCTTKFNSVDCTCTSKLSRCSKEEERPLAPNHSRKVLYTNFLSQGNASPVRGCTCCSSQQKHLDSRTEKLATCVDRSRRCRINGRTRVRVRANIRNRRSEVAAMCNDTFVVKDRGMEPSTKHPVPQQNNRTALERSTGESVTLFVSLPR